MQAHGQNLSNYAHGIFDDLLGQQIFDVKKTGEIINRQFERCKMFNNEPWYVE